MIEVELPDGRIVEFPDGTSRDVMRGALQKLNQSDQPSTGADMSFGGRIKDNVVGVDDGVESTGEKAGNVIRAGTAAVARGIADIPALPANLAQLGAMGYEKLTGAEEPSAVSRALDRLPDTRDMLASVPVIGPESQYRMEGTAGDYISTAGEFAGGAGVLGGPGAMVRYGALPGVASEAAGQATEGTKYEPYARTAAALGTSILAAPKPGKFPETSQSAKMANRLQSEGVRDITVGQARGSQTLMRLEGRLAPTEGQIDDFTAATMRQLGSTDDLATPTALFKVEQRLVKQMDDAVSGVDIVPPATYGQRAIDAAEEYAKSVPEVSLNPRIRGIANEITSLSKAGKPVSASLLKKWRSNIGKLSTSPDQPTRAAAHEVRRIIDDMTDEALTAAGRTDDILTLKQARESYRDFIGVRDAASRAGAEGGTLSPAALNQSLIRAQGRESYATGRTTPMGDFTRSGAAVLRPAPTVNPGGQRTITEALPAGMAAGGGAAAFGLGLGPAGIAGMAAAGAAAPAISQSIMRSNPVQSMMRAPVRTLAQPYPTLPGLLQSLED